MTLKKIITASLAAIVAGTMLTSCSQPNLENLLPFKEEPKVKEYSSVVEGSALKMGGGKRRVETCLRLRGGVGKRTTLDSGR